MHSIFRWNWRTALIWVALLPICTTPSIAGQLEDGIAAQAQGNYALALNLLRPLALQGDATGQFHLSLMYANGQAVPPDLKESVKWLRLSARQGHAAAQSNLGTSYSRGKGVVQDYVHAYAWFSISAAQGNQEAVTNLEVARMRMTAQQIQEAKTIALACVQASLRGCD